MNKGKNITNIVMNLHPWLECVSVCVWQCSVENFCEFKLQFSPASNCNLNRNFITWFKWEFVALMRPTKWKTWKPINRKSCYLIKFFRVWVLLLELEMSNKPLKSNWNLYFAVYTTTSLVNLNILVWCAVSPIDNWILCFLFFSKILFVCWSQCQSHWWICFGILMLIRAKPLKFTRYWLYLTFICVRISELRAHFLWDNIRKTNRRWNNGLLNGKKVSVYSHSLFCIYTFKSKPMDAATQFNRFFSSIEFLYVTLWNDS